MLNTNTGELRLYALGTILTGEEIFVTYVAGQSIYGNSHRNTMCSRPFFLRLLRLLSPSGRIQRK
jgi:hypothetical protein